MSAQKKYKMYENPIMEFLSISGPKMMITYHLIIICTLLIIGIRTLYPANSWLLLIGIFVSGLIIWSITEYIMHRFIFHFERDNKIVKAFHFAMHGYHHEKPNDENRLFMPPVPATLFLLVFFALFYLIIGVYAWIFLPGFELGYLLYSFIHYSIHTRKAPMPLKDLWHHHILHHYKTPEKAYGVSSRFWDRVFRTMPEDQMK